MKHKLRMLFLGVALLVGAFSGVPMRPEDVEELMAATNREETVYVISEDEGNDDETIREIKKMIAGDRK